MADSPARPTKDECAEFYQPYIAAAGEPLLEGLERDAQSWRALLAAVPPDREGHRYQAGKWSVRELVGHVTDAERAFCVRAMAFARGDRSHFPSFDQDAYAAASRADRRSLASLAEEFSTVRAATLTLLGSFEDDVWDLRGTASGYKFTVRSLAWIIAGHSRHHRRVLAERYLGLRVPNAETRAAMAESEEMMRQGAATPGS